MTLAQQLGVLLRPIGAHSLQTMTRMEFGGIASSKKR